MVEEDWACVGLGHQHLACLMSDPFTIFFFFNDTATTEIYTLSLHDALPIFSSPLSSGFFSVSFFLLSPLCGVLPCLALSLASGCLTREYYPNAEKEVLNQVRQ